MRHQHFKKDKSSNSAGYCYLMEVTNLPPGVYFKTRFKIGLSQQPEKRRQTLISTQPGHDLKIVKAIYVSNMSMVETSLHKSFAKNRVKLEKSREYFDLLPHQVIMLIFLMAKLDLHSPAWVFLPFKKIAIIFLTVLGLGLLLSLASPRSQESIHEVPKTENLRNTQ